MIYKVCMCKSCGRHSTTTSGIAFTCAYCRKRFQFKLKKQFGLNVKIKYKGESPREASRICGEENGKTKNFKGF